MILALLSLTTPAHAFCGTYVGQAGAELYNAASQVAIVRQGTRTTLTLANEYEGDATAFALLVPVPQILGPDDVTTVDPALFTRLDAYSAPRLVTYTCEDFNVDYDSADTASDGGGGRGEDADGSVTVEAEFQAGEYDIVILSAEESDGLLTWLDDNGYGVDETAATVLGEYIDAGAYFFAAKVALDRLPEGSSYLSPLRFSYEAEVFGLPIRLGTLNSPGYQDLILYAVNDYASGAVGVGNYPEATLEDECMWKPDVWPTFAEFYAAQFGTAMASTDGASWVREYAWGGGGCDPCAGTPPGDTDLAAIGFSGTSTEAFFTRLHMRYGPGDADQDLALYLSNDPTFGQIRYIQYDERLEEHFPVCGEGWIEDGGTCDDAADTDTPGGVDEGGGDDKAAATGCGCASPGSPAVGLGLVAAALVARRRRA